MENAVLDLPISWFDGTVSTVGGRVFSSDCTNIISSHLLNVVGPTLDPVQSDEQVSLTHRFSTLGASTLNFVEFGDADYAMSGCFAPNTFMISIILHGEVEIVVDGRKIALRPGMAMVTNPLTEIQSRGTGGFRGLAIMLDRVSLAKVLSKRTGRLVTEDICFDAISPVASRLPTAFPKTLMERLAAAGRAAPRRNIETELSFEEQLAALVLDTFCFELKTHALPDCRTGEPAQLKRAEEYIRNNFAYEISLEELALWTGFAPRTLQRAFSEHRGMTWIEYLRIVRLDHARHQLLCGGSGGASVTNLAFDSGFTHLGRFSVEYRHRFAESPSVTWRKTRDRLSQCQNPARPFALPY
jgi:AraC-like DNA-binding protein